MQPNDSEKIPPSTKIPNYVKENPFRTLVNVGSVIGGLLAFAFFVKIGYLPELDLQDATTLLIGIALVGIGTTIIFAICLTFPSWLIYGFLTARVSPPTTNSYRPETLESVRTNQTKNLITSSILIGVLVISQ